MATEHGRAVRRALRVLFLINERDMPSLSDLVGASGLAKTTVHRLLSTLEDEGYVRAAPGRPGSYLLTGQARNLSRGVTPQILWAEAVDPIIAAGAKAIGWPLSFAIREGSLMRILCCGRVELPERAARPSRLGETLDIFSSASGRAWLSAFDEHGAREAVRPSDSAERKVASTPTTTSEVSHGPSVEWPTGVAIRQAQKGEPDASMAVPIRLSRGPIGAIACSTFPKLLTDDFVSRALPQLRQISLAVADACERAEDIP